MINPLIPICLAIKAGYAAEKSGLDDDMVPHLIDLADHVDVILLQCAHVAAQHESLGRAADRIHKLELTLREIVDDLETNQDWQCALARANIAVAPF